MPLHLVDFLTSVHGDLAAGHEHHIGMWDLFAHGLKTAHVTEASHDYGQHHSAFLQDASSRSLIAGTHGDVHNMGSWDWLHRGRRSHASQLSAAFLEAPQSALQHGHSDFFPAVHGTSHYVGAGRAASSSFLSSSFSSVQEKLHSVVLATPPSILVPLHAASIVFAVPGHIAFELGEGYMFGLKKGFALAFTGKFVGAGASFVIGRSAHMLGGMRDVLKQKLDAWPSASCAAKAVERRGAFSVFVIRLAPVPCVVKNYSLALLTDIPLGTYLCASFLGLAPTTAAHVFAGTLATSASDLISGNMSHIQKLAAASPVIAGVLLTLWAGYMLHQQMHIADEESEDPHCSTRCGLSTSTADGQQQWLTASA